MPRISANGLDFEYESFGRASDPTILLIMGFAAQMTLWPDALCHGFAAQGFRVVRYDNRDVGKSTHLLSAGAPVAQELMGKLMAGEKVTVPYTLDDMAKDAAALLDALGIAKAHIAGASMGGMIAQLVAINHPAKTKSLISIMSTSGKRGLRPANAEALKTLVQHPASAGRADLIDLGIRIRHALGSPGFPSSDAETRARVEREVDRVPYEPTGFARQMAAIIAAPPRSDLLKSVRAPALVLHGDADPLFGVDAAEDVAKSIPGAELVIVPGMGHECCDALVPVYLKHMGEFARRVEALG